MSGNEKALVTVVIPVYNSEKFISDCFNSVLNQTYKNIELVVIDDGSEDSSAEIIKRCVEKHNNIKYYYQENGGAGAARNSGIGKASGKYLTFLDVDDRFAPDYIEKMVHAMESGAMLAVSGYTMVSASGKVLSTYKTVDKPLSFLGNSATCGKMYDMQFIKENGIHFLEEGKLLEDAYFFIKAYSLSFKTVAADTSGYMIFQNDTSITHTAGKSISIIDDVLKTLSIIKSDIEGKLSQSYILSYFLYKSAVYCILFACKGAEKSALYEKYDMLFGWIEDNTETKNNPCFAFFKDNGERFSVKFIILMFRMLKKLGLIKLAIYVFSKL